MLLINIFIKEIQKNKKKNTRLLFYFRMIIKRVTVFEFKKKVFYSV